ncbi:MAG: hypothetical protein WAZ27_01035 [Minisyncoccia bacterium]
MKKIALVGACALAIVGCSEEPRWKAWKWAASVSNEDGNKKTYVFQSDYVTSQDVRMACGIIRECDGDACSQRVLFWPRKPEAFSACHERVEKNPPNFERVKVDLQTRIEAPARFDELTRSFEDREVLRKLDELSAKQARSKKP